jgi:hypothetical protein
MRRWPRLRRRRGQGATVVVELMIPPPRMTGTSHLNGRRFKTPRKFVFGRCKFSAGRASISGGIAAASVEGGEFRPRREAFLGNGPRFAGRKSRSFSGSIAHNRCSTRADAESRMITIILKWTARTWPERSKKHARGWGGRVSGETLRLRASDADGIGTLEGLTS